MLLKSLTSILILIDTDEGDSKDGYMEHIMLRWSLVNNQWNIARILIHSIFLISSNIWYIDSMIDIELREMERLARWLWRMIIMLHQSLDNNQRSNNHQYQYHLASQSIVIMWVTVPWNLDLWKFTFSWFSHFVVLGMWMEIWLEYK